MGFTEITSDRKVMWAKPLLLKVLINENFAIPGLPPGLDNFQK